MHTVAGRDADNCYRMSIALSTRQVIPQSSPHRRPHCM